MIKRDLYYERIPTKSLREDVRYLGNILGQVIKKQEGITFFNLVEKVRKLSKANKSNKAEKRSHLNNLMLFALPLIGKNLMIVNGEEEIGQLSILLMLTLLHTATGWEVY